MLAGVDHLVGRGIAHPDRVGVGGGSYGGILTNYLVTRTDIFAAAESGAPVVNMFSAYGGIRWGSGRSRQFQYEQTQSRIGGTPWSHPMRYWENSPLFHLDKANIDNPSAKLDVLIPHLEELLEEGHKALVFSQFTSMLAIARKH